MPYWLIGVLLVFGLLIFGCIIFVSDKDRQTRNKLIEKLKTQDKIETATFILRFQKSESDDYNVYFINKMTKHKNWLDNSQNMTKKRIYEELRRKWDESTD